jgi:hypothetical protein
MRKLEIKRDDLPETMAQAGYAPDPNGTHRRVVERRHCSDTYVSLRYSGYSNHENYLAFGACVICDAVFLFDKLSDIFTDVPAALGERREEKQAA